MALVLAIDQSIWLIWLGYNFRFSCDFYMPWRRNITRRSKLYPPQVEPSYYQTLTASEQKSTRERERKRWLLFILNCTDLWSAGSETLNLRERSQRSNRSIDRKFFMNENWILQFFFIFKLELIVCLKFKKNSEIDSSLYSVFFIYIVVPRYSFVIQGRHKYP